MSVSHIEFISGSTQRSRDKTDKTERDFSLCYAYPVIDDDRKTSDVLAKNKGTLRVSNDRNSSATEDGLYVSENPLTNKLIKPYQLDVKQLDYESRPRFRGKLVEIAIREIRIHSPRESDQSNNAATIEIVSVSILFKGKPICKANSPFNRKLYKLMIRDSECHDLSIQVHSRHNKSSVLPLPLPQRCNVKDHVVDIDFAIGNGSQRIHAGIVACTISLSTYGSDEPKKNSECYLYRPSNDPNDPQNGLSLLRPQSRRPADKKNVKYFLLEDPALIFDSSDVSTTTRKTSSESKSLDIVVTEQPAFSLLDVSFKNLFRANRPLRPSSSAHHSRHHNVGRTILTVNVLRGVEVPVREESALVSPLLEVEWGNIIRTTSVADGPAPIWQQTLHFELPRQNTGEHCVKFRLYDQHPVWGQQWLGEARIPLERHRNYQELERWIALSPLFSPVLLFGYAQASPGQSHTRIYVLMRLEQPGNSMEANTIDTLSKGVQRCLVHPYKVSNIETPDDAARFVMLLSSLPIHYGPVAPRQALNVNKVDHYGRAALLATLLQGFGLQSYVLLGI